ncbi:uncharacterized protein BCR38DRAFT_200193 [Pseudomassariella vexata]|uniref:Uncharacterized protein n=1 Tax=Pseudomassariella vexata TaxID=1141098 RepID=A0A1Y2E3T4_9PEZI|nr:uncharacterized protein BCR38DRAFT_200193 [Pseudomassariella vexata]ORY65535.1 hypothetical protein BCR38DRAFT_200193 [Pseudomassariella vexata]
MAGPRLTGPRLTAPAARLVARSLSTTTSSASLPQSTTFVTAARTSAPLSRKYADLLKERNLDAEHPRHIYTRSSNRPHPPPRRLRLMQTFTSSASTSSQADRSSIDFTVLPGSAALEHAAADPYSRVRVPLLPDNYASQYAPETLATNEPVQMPEISIIASNPDSVSPAPLSEIEGMGVDGIELKFAHEAPSASRSVDSEPGMLTDLWKGLMDDVLGAENSKGKLAV